MSNTGNNNFDSFRLVKKEGFSTYYQFMIVKVKPSCNL